MSELGVMAIWQAFALAIGLCLGSFANLAVDRMPRDQSLFPRSRCDVCAHPIRPRDLVPVFSWLWLRGRCRDCGTWIGAHTPLVELFVGLLSVILWRVLIPDVASIDTPHVAAWAVYLLFLLLLTIASYVDVRHRIIPDETSIYAIPVAIGCILLLSWLGYDGWLAMDWRRSVGGAVFAGGLFGFAALVAGAVRGSEALGFGDVKMIAMIGAFVGPLPGVMAVMIMGSILGTAVGLALILIYWRRPWIAFGPALATGAALYVLFGREIVNFFFPGMAQLF